MNVQLKIPLSRRLPDQAGTDHKVYRYKKGECMLTFASSSIGKTGCTLLTLESARGAKGDICPTALGWVDS